MSRATKYVETKRFSIFLEDLLLPLDDASIKKAFFAQANQPYRRWVILVKEDMEYWLGTSDVGQYYKVVERVSSNHIEDA